MDLPKGTIKGQTIENVTVTENMVTIQAYSMPNAKGALTSYKKPTPLKFKKRARLIN